MLSSITKLFDRGTVPTSGNWSKFTLLGYSEKGLCCMNLWLFLAWLSMLNWCRALLVGVWGKCWALPVSGFWVYAGIDTLETSEGHSLCQIAGSKLVVSKKASCPTPLSLVKPYQSVYDYFIWPYIMSRLFLMLGLRSNPNPTPSLGETHSIS